MEQKIDMELNIQIIGFRVEIKPIVGRKDNIKAFVQWFFYTVEDEKVNFWKLAWGTIRLKEFGESKKKILAYDGAAVRSRNPGGNPPFKYNKVLFMENLELYKKLSSLTVKKYVEVAGELPSDVSIDITENIDLDDLPF